MAETCSLVEKTLKKREEKEKAMKEKERRKKEERARKKQQACGGREREASETRQTECRNDREEVSNPTSGGGETPTQTSAGAEDRQWLCEHYKRLCRVKFPCCGKFFPCHRCHNNSGCPNDNSKAREACYVQCSVCSHQQEVFSHVIYQNLINVEMDKLHLDYMRFALMLSSSLRSTRTPKPVLDVKQSSQHISALCVNTSRAQTKIHITA